MVITNDAFLNGLQCGLLSQWWSEYIEEEGVIRNPQNTFHKDNYLMHGQNAQTNGIPMTFFQSPKKQVLSAWVPLIYLSFPFPQSWLILSLLAIRGNWGVSMWVQQPVVIYRKQRKIVLFADYLSIERFGFQLILQSIKDISWWLIPTCIFSSPLTKLISMLIS